MTVEEILAHAKKYSQSFSNPKSTWTTQREAMCLKTVHKQNLSKWAPMTQDMELALNFDQAAVKNAVTYLENGEDVITEYPDGNEDMPEKTTEVEQPKNEGGGLSTEQMSQGDPSTHQGYKDKAKDDQLPDLRTECKTLLFKCLEVGAIDKEYEADYLKRIAEGDEVKLNAIRSTLTSDYDEFKPKPEAAGKGKGKF
jgi:hypothetical protein